MSRIMSTDGRIDKYPTEDLDYEFDFSSALASSESISSYTVRIPSGLATGGCTTLSATVSAVVVPVSGGTAGISYGVYCQIVTSQPRTYERVMTIKVKNP